MKNAKYMIIVILLVLIIVLLAAIFISQKNENSKKEIKNLIEKIEEEKLYTVKTSKEQGAVYAVEISEK